MWPSSPPSWLLPWAIWRFRNKVGPKPIGVPPNLTGHWCWKFLAWAEWCRLGRPAGKRPAGLPREIPKAYWNVLKLLNIAVPPKPLPEPPPPPNPIPPSSWHLPGPLMMLAWGPVVDTIWTDTDEGLRRCQAAGVRTIALQAIGGQPQFSPNFPDRCREYVEHVVIWGEPHPDDSIVLAQAGADGYLPQTETEEQFRNCMTNLRNDVGRSTGNLSTVTTLAAFNTWTTRPDGTQEQQVCTAEVEALIEEGLTHAWVECYDWDVRPMSVGAQLGHGARVGLYHQNPVIGLARHAVAIADYQPAIDRYGKQVGAYLAEGMNSTHWADFGAL